MTNWIPDPGESFPARGRAVDADKLYSHLLDNKHILSKHAGMLSILEEKLSNQQGVLNQIMANMVQAKLFMDWMREVHPGVIEAYTKATEVAERMK